MAKQGMTPEQSQTLDAWWQYLVEQFRPDRSGRNQIDNMLNAVYGNRITSGERGTMENRMAAFRREFRKDPDALINEAKRRSGGRGAGFIQQQLDARIVRPAPTPGSAAQARMADGWQTGGPPRTTPTPGSAAQGRRANEMPPAASNSGRMRMPDERSNAETGADVGTLSAGAGFDPFADGYGFGSAGGGGGGGGLGPSGASSEPPNVAAMSAEELAAYIRRTYGYAATFLDHPEIGPLLRQAAEQGWDEARLAGALARTRWWQETSASARQWQQLEGADPATAQQQVASRLAEATTQASSLGIASAPDRLRTIAVDSLRFGWSDQQLRTALVSELRYDPQVALQGDIAAQSRSVKETARAYMLTVGDDQAFQWATRILNGSLTPEGLDAMFAQQARGRFPSLAQQIDQGIRPAEIFEPYRQQIAAMLEIAPAEVDFMGPRFAAVIDYVAPGEDPSKRRSMTLAETQRYVKGLPEYDRTLGAKREAAQMAEYLTSTFGGVR